VSVILPLYNGQRYLREAVESVRLQEYPSLEIIVVDDGSTDGSASLVDELGEDLLYLYQSHRGPSAARNTGLGVAGGELVAFIDADDLWPPGKLDLQVERLLNEPELVVVSGRVQYFGLDSGVVRRMRFEGPDQTVINVNLGSAVFRRSVFERVGGFDESLFNWEDLDWFLRAKEMGVRIKILRQITLRYRMHEHNYSQTVSSEHGMMVVLAKSAARRRKMKIRPGSIPLLSDFDER
jgi:glycosyltransferase involved in cell wall biosynthesis